MSSDEPPMLVGHRDRRVKLGNRGSKLHDVKLVVIQVLVRAERPLRLSEVCERGWPAVFGHPDDLGLILGTDPDYEAKLAERLHRHRLERDTGVALRDLRRKRLAASTQPEGWRALLWFATDETRPWMDAEGAEFRASVLSDLDVLLVASGHKDQPS